MTVTQWLDLIAENCILWPNSNEGRPTQKGFVIMILVRILLGLSTVIGDGLFTRNGTSDIDSLFGFRAMDFPKPVKMIEQLIEQVISKDDIILDFFCGSATTAHAVMQLNAEDASTGSARLASVSSSWCNCPKPATKKAKPTKQVTKPSPKSAKNAFAGRATKSKQKTPIKKA